MWIPFRISMSSVSCDRYNDWTLSMMFNSSHTAHSAHWHCSQGSLALTVQSATKVSCSDFFYHTYIYTYMYTYIYIYTCVYMYIHVNGGFFVFTTDGVNTTVVTPGVYCVVLILIHWLCFGYHDGYVLTALSCQLFRSCDDWKLFYINQNLNFHGSMRKHCLLCDT